MIPNLNANINLIQTSFVLFFKKNIVAQDDITQIFYRLGFEILHLAQ